MVLVPQIHLLSYTLIHTKPYPKILDSFNEELLFLNSYYFMFAVDNNYKVQKELKARYKKIYVTTCKSIFLKDLM